MKAQVPASKDDDVFVVIDIETAPPRSSPFALPLGSLERTSLSHEITAIAILIAARQTDAAWRITTVQSWNSSQHSEFEILLALNRRLAPLLVQGATLVTFNGIRHDVPAIRRRAAFHRMFELTTWRAMLTCRHRDLMVDGITGRQARWSSLKDTCHSLHIPCESDFPSAARATVEVTRRKCETDVCSTYVIFLYLLALETGDDRDLSKGWRALADYVHRVHPSRPHLVQFKDAAEDQGI